MEAPGLGLRNGALARDHLDFQLVQCIHGGFRGGESIVGERRLQSAPARVVNVGVLERHGMDFRGLLRHGRRQNREIDAFGKLFLGEGTNGFVINGQFVPGRFQTGDFQRLLIERIYNVGRLQGQRDAGVPTNSVAWETRCRAASSLSPSGR